MEADFHEESLPCQINPHHGGWPNLLKMANQIRKVDSNSSMLEGIFTILRFERLVINKSYLLGQTYPMAPFGV